MKCAVCGKEVQFNWGNNKIPVCHLCARTMTDSKWDKISETLDGNTKCILCGDVALTKEVYCAKCLNKIKNGVHINTWVLHCELMVILSALAEYKYNHNSDIAGVLIDYFVDCLEKSANENKAIKVEGGE